MSDRETLPKAVKPVHYDLSIYDLKFAGSWTYNGTVKIDTKVVEETAEIVLNVKEVEVKSAEVTAGKSMQDPRSTQTSHAHDA
ncbi:hypothetical protein KEM52_005017 [Ascosphaera acerosa]|nr:hypothetical protein KEM52_005017 [Ascosphaera acerosa]